jgi:transposase
VPPEYESRSFRQPAIRREYAVNNDLTNAQWRLLEPHLPAPLRIGRPRHRSRRVLIDGIRWHFRTGSAWYRTPPRYGPHQTVSGLYHTWIRNGTWDALFDALGGGRDALAVIPWMCAPDQPAKGGSRTRP